MNRSRHGSASRHLAAVWFADLVGFSTIAAENEACALRLVSQFQEVCTRTVAEHGGRLIKFIGDSALAEFPSTELAARSALDLQAEFTAASGHLLRIGIHIGDIVSAPDGDVYGDGVNTTARIQELARPGQVWSSEDVKSHLRSDPNFRLTRQGEHVLKGMLAPTRLYSLAYADAPEIAPGASQPISRRFVVALASMGACLVLGLGGYALIGLTGQPSAAGMASHSARAMSSVAVLPFANRSADPENQYFSDGVSEEILNTLAGIEGLHVPGRTSAFRFRGNEIDLSDAARQLGVTHVLEGSVQREGDRVRITTQLVSAEDGYQLWSGRYDREVGDIFAVYDEIAHEVSSALRVRLMGGDSVRLVRPTTSDLEAYDHYLLGRHQWNRRTPEGFADAITSFRAAVARDSSYALAHAGLADVFSLLAAYDYGVLSPLQAMPLAKVAAKRALDIDPGLAQAHAALGNIHFYFDRDWAAAEREFRRALELNPGYAQTLHWYSLFLLARDRRAAARDAIVRAAEIEPFNVVMITGLARHYYFVRDFERSIEVFRSALEMDSTFLTAHLGIGLAYLESGAPQRAIEHYEIARRLLGSPQPVVLALLAHAHARSGQTERARELLGSLESRAAAGEYIPPEYLALVHLALGNRERVFHWLDRAYENRSSALAIAHLEPLLDPLRSDPRFQDLLRRVGV